MPRRCTTKARTFPGTADASLDGGAPDAASDAALDDATAPDAGPPVTVEVQVATAYVAPSGEVVELGDVSGGTVSAYAEGDPSAPATGVVAADGLLASAARPMLGGWSSSAPAAPPSRS